MSHGPRLFAVIPAAGHSKRMGQPKLMLPLRGMTIIERVLNALNHPTVAARIVVIRHSDQLLAETAQRAGGLVVAPEIDPVDMRASVSCALNVIQKNFSPSDSDGWLLVPADHPALDSSLIEALISNWNADQPRILVPCLGGRRGHPTLFRWRFARDVSLIPPDRGLNWLLSEYAAEVQELPVESDSALIDLDTPEDYERLLRS